LLSDFHVFDLNRFNYFVDHRGNILTKEGYKIDDFAIGAKPADNQINIVQHQMDKGAVMRKSSPKESPKSKRSKEDIGSSQTLLNIYTSNISSPDKS